MWHGSIGNENRSLGKISMQRRIALPTAIAISCFFGFSEQAQSAEKMLVCQMTEQFDPNDFLVPSSDINQTFVLKFDELSRTVTFIHGVNIIIEDTSQFNHMFDELITFQGVSPRYGNGFSRYSGHVDRNTGRIKLVVVLLTEGMEPPYPAYEQRGLCELAQKKF